jgi:hypothetical protein
MIVANNPFAGAVPLNYRQGVEEAVEKAVTSGTSYRNGETHHTEYRNQFNDKTLNRNEGCTPLRRYPNGTLDHKYVAHQVIDVLHKMKDGGNVTDFERALLTLVLPGKFKELIDPKIAQTMTKLSNDERMMLGIMVEQHLREELNWNAGAGGGSVPGRSSSRG